MRFAELRPELDDQLAALAAKGWSSTRIGRELGVTRNVVIGRCRRRGFPLTGGRMVVNSAPHPEPEPKQETICKPSPSRTGKGRAPRQFSRTAPKVAPLSKKLLAAAAPVAAVEPREWPPVGVLGLTSQTCRWPISDDPSSADFQYCGAPKELGPYCAAHSRVAYTPRGIDKARRDAAREASR